MSQKTYSRLMKLGMMLARHCFSAILHAKYHKQQLRGEIIEQADRDQIPLQIVYCTAPEEVLRSRLVKRTGEG